ncbi:YtcA family lipoprotein [Paraburkholderia sediminicola]|uniref:hypothetical protein n=1 Tax=Paraburkholderia sediminicola TaxID=458836 RepID=UPI0038BC4646
MLGAYFPDWLFCIVGGILLARDRAPSRKAFRRTKVAVVAFASDRTVALYQRGLADRLARRRRSSNSLRKRSRWWNRGAHA